MKNIQRELSQADPLNHVALLALPDAAVKALAQEIVMHEQSTVRSRIEQPADIPAARPRRWRHRIAVGLLAGGIIAVPTVAVAALGGMHTGFFGTGGENAPGEEFLNSNDPQISGVVQGLTREFPLPAGASYGPLLKGYPTKVNTLAQRTSLAQSVSFYAQCIWYQDWLKGDATQRAADQATIDAMPTWKYWHFAIDSRTGDNSGLESLNEIAAETRVGTTTMITQFVKVNCLGRSPLLANPDPSPKP